MRYREIRPREAAARFVRCYWQLEDDGVGGEPQRIVPDGRPELILNLGEPYQSLQGSVWKAQPRCFLMGQITRPLFLRSAGPVKVMGVRFHPHTAQAAFGVPMSELTDLGAMALEDFSPVWLRRFEGITEFDELDRVMGGLGNVADSNLSLAVQELERTGGLLDVRSVADRMGVSVRQFERRFKAAVGISPKRFGRMQRFQRVFRAVEDGRERWAEVAAWCGYYDQAHLIRDFQEFAGKPPAALLDEQTDLARHFVQTGI